MQSPISRHAFLLLICLFLLFSFGLIGQFSSAGGNMQPFVSHQLMVFGVSFPIMLLLWYTDSEVFIKNAHVFYILCILLLLVVTVLGKSAMGAARWIKFQNLTLQPSEIMKVSLIFMLAKYFDSKKSHQLKTFSSFVGAGVITGIPAILILKQPNLGTTTILCSIALGMIFVTPTKIRYVVGLISVVASSLPIAWSFLHEYQKSRIVSFLNPEKDPLGIGYNTMQSKIAIGSGSVFGSGFISGTQTQLSFLPEKQTDFIFTVISEEWGFVGSASVMLVYSLLVYTSIDIALTANRYHDKLIAIGISCFFMAHFFMNIGMVTGLLPVVGVPLPILSYGGSITLASLMSIGTLLSITKSNLNNECNLYAS